MVRWVMGAYQGAMAARARHAEARMGAWPLDNLADWFERQSLRRDLPLAEQLMLENVSAWLRGQHQNACPNGRLRDPWSGLSND